MSEGKGATMEWQRELFDEVGNWGKRRDWAPTLGSGLNGKNDFFGAPRAVSHEGKGAKRNRERRNKKTDERC